MRLLLALTLSLVVFALTACPDDSALNDGGTPVATPSSGDAATTESGS